MPYIVYNLLYDLRRACGRDFSGKRKRVDRPDAALWTYRRTNRLAQVSWGHGRKLIEPAVLSFEQKAADEMPLVEAKVATLIKDGKTEEAKAYLTRYSFDFIYATLRCWEEMEAQLWHQFGRGF